MPIPPGAEHDPDEYRRHIKHSPGMLVAQEVEKCLEGKAAPLTPEDIEVAVPILSQAAQVVSPVPALVWKQVFKRLLPKLHSTPVNIIAILAGIYLPLLVYLNARHLSEFLIDHGLFQVMSYIHDMLR